MRRTLVAVIFSLGLSACGGVVEEAPPAETVAEENTHSAMACSVTDPMCSSIEGTACAPKDTRYCCQDGYWIAKCFCWSVNGYKWACEQ